MFFHGPIKMNLNEVILVFKLVIELVPPHSAFEISVNENWVWKRFWGLSYVLFWQRTFMATRGVIAFAESRTRIRVRNWRNMLGWRCCWQEMTKRSAVVLWYRIETSSPLDLACHLSMVARSLSFSPKTTFCFSSASKTFWKQILGHVTSHDIQWGSAMNFVKVFMHPKYRYQAADNHDLAIFQLLEPIQKFTRQGYSPKTTLPLCVPQLSWCRNNLWRIYFLDTWTF